MRNNRVELLLRQRVLTRFRVQPGHNRREFARELLPTLLDETLVLIEDARLVARALLGEIELIELVRELERRLRDAEHEAIAGGRLVGLCVGDKLKRKYGKIVERYIRAIFIIIDRFLSIFL